MSDQEIFTPEELNENIQRKRELIELVASNEAVLMVGAGSSVRVGYVSWRELLKRLEDLASKFGDGFPKDDERRVNDPTGYAAAIKSHMRKRGALNRYHAEVSRLFQSRNPQYDNFHKTLVALPFRGILTTNYDPVLDAALSASETKFPHDFSLVVGSSPPSQIHEFLIRMNNDSRIPRRIAHLHGKYDIPESIVLGSDDYSKAYGVELLENDSGRPSQSGWTLHRKLLWAILATRRVLFVGFGMNDPYFNRMLETVSSDLWGWEKATHYTIASISLENGEDRKAKAARLKREYGVGTVFYEPVDNSHSELDHIIDEIAKECGNDVQSASVRRGATGSAKKTEEEEDSPKSIQSASPGLLDWLNRANRRMLGFGDNEN